METAHFIIIICECIVPVLGRRVLGGLLPELLATTQPQLVLYDAGMPDVLACICDKHTYLVLLAETCVYGSASSFASGFETSEFNP